ncbi:MAG: pyridoxine 5'-phosphate synthase [Bacteroidia bacterium]|nr:pyridoxine 5'-phosphate synthase [Bacteroidia bacterium]MDW8302078.1 pyridoxine 5'-phosphate synthase [Bacteroidia bacterium]
MPPVLSVNVNKVATLRNARGGNVPDVIKCVEYLQNNGAEGITVHPRPDERHITRKDVSMIAKIITVEFNIEGYPDQRYLDIIEEVKPAQATLVPDPPNVLTSNAGWQIDDTNLKLLAQAVEHIKRQSPQTRISVFINPFDVLEKNLSVLKNIGVDRIELFTGPYAHTFSSKSSAEIDNVLNIYKTVALHAVEVGLKINAGHDLDLHNLPKLVSTIPFISEVSIGQAFISDSLWYGFRETLLRYKLALRP